MPLPLADPIGFIRLGRLQFLVAGFILFLLGALLAAGAGTGLFGGRLLFGYAVLAAGHLSVSYSNDYFDYEADKGSQKGPFNGGSRVLLERPWLRPAALWFSIALIALSIALGLAFAFVYRMPFGYIAFVVAGNLLGFFYTAPPLRLIYRGWGEAAAVIGIGFFVPAAGALSATGTLPPAFAAFLPVLLLYGLYFILSVEIPDAAADAAAGKSTLVARRGPKLGFVLIAATALAATLYLALAPGTAIAGAAAILSLVPLLPAVGGLLLRPAGARAEKIIGLNIVGLVAFALLLDLCLLLLVSP